MFQFNLNRNLLTAIVAATFIAAVNDNARADILGQHHPGMTRQQPVAPAPRPNLATAIKHKKVVSVTTFVVNSQGVQRTVTWDFTSHQWNPATGQWVELQWGQSYIRAIQGLNAQGWRAYNAQSNGTRQVTGTW